MVSCKTEVHKINFTIEYDEYDVACDGMTINAEDLQ